MGENVEEMPDYDAILSDGRGSPSDLVAHLTAVLPDLWCERYWAMAQGPSNILEFEDRGFTFLFDLTSTIDESDVPEDRVVATYGVTLTAPKGRDNSRRRGHPLGVNPEEIDGEYDRGHFIAHLSGGSLDVNLFPQKREVNRGWSEEGKLFRRMELYAGERPGTFCFACPLYQDLTCCPAILEYGVLKEDGTLWVERFSNA